MTEADQLWNDCSDSLRSQVSEATWRAWFAAIRPVAVANGTLILAVPSGVVRDRLEGRFHGLVHDALLDTSGKEVVFRFDVQIDDPGPEEIATNREIVQRGGDESSSSPTPVNRAVQRGPKTARVPTMFPSTRSTPSTPSSPDLRIALPTPPRCRWRRHRRGPTTLCSSTARLVSARLIYSKQWELRT